MTEPRTPTVRRLTWPYYNGGAALSVEDALAIEREASDRQAMQLTYDEATDAVYVYFSHNEVDRTEELSDDVVVDYDATGEPVGVEFLDVSQGIDLDAVARLLCGANR